MKHTVGRTCLSGRQACLSGRQVGMVLGVALASLWGVSTGQVRRIGGGGQALDASLQVGSGGINYAVPQNYTPNTGMSSLTQSRGLSAFMGHAPSISNQLSVGVSTDGVDRFRQQGVSVQQAVHGGSALYDPQNSMYNSRLTTYLRPSDIVKAGYGRRVPIAGAAPVSQKVKLAENLFVDATSNFKPIMPSTIDEDMVGNALSLPRTEGGTQSEVDTQWVHALDARQLADRGGRDMFGMLRQKDRTNLAQEISDFDKADEAPGALDLLVKPVEETKPIGPIDSRFKSTGLVERLESPTEEGTSTSLRDQTPQGLEAQRLQNRSLQTQNMQQKDLRTGLPRTNSDPYFDMLVQFRQRQLTEGNRNAGGLEGNLPDDKTRDGMTPGGGAPIATTPNGKTPEGNQPAPRPTLHPMDEALLQRMKTAVPLAGRPRNIELTPNNEIIIHRLAGESDDTFNRYMRRAESAMKARRFYEAARQYSLASMARPTNPMAHLGVCMANVAANEWLTSAAGLRRAMELFPPLMETRLDLKQLIPVQDWPGQLELMEQWVKKVDDQPMMLFLAAFIEFNSGRTNVAKQHAEALLKLDNLPKILPAYAEYVKTGKLPAKVKPRRRGGEPAAEN